MHADLKVLYCYVQQSYSGAILSRKMQLTTALDRVRAVLNNSPHNIMDFDLGIYGKCYLVSVQQGQGLQWNELPKDLAKPNLLRISADRLEIDFIKKVYTS